MAEDDPETKSYKIGEVCRLADVQPYVLRYWETEFPPLAPTRTGGAQRLYSQREVDIILRIKNLLYGEGFTIAGAKKRLEAELAAPAESAGPAMTADDPPATGGASSRRLIGEVRRELRDILKLLDR